MLRDHEEQRINVLRDRLVQASESERAALFARLDQVLITASRGATARRQKPVTPLADDAIEDQFDNMPV
ncbi:hypothetical protein [Primorskyibacter sp. S187A]|uniref:hypothetical protein n=1 Tax=Primorskyibacter sp. S187A TaxID=3415130 RepID=UPI003C7A21EE